MADFIVSGQIPGTSFQITFIVWAVLVALLASWLLANITYRSKTVRGLVVANKIQQTVRKHSFASN